MERKICLSIARELLRLTQKELANELEWSSSKQISNIELGKRPMQKQTELAIECLLRRASLWSEYLSQVKSKKNSHPLPCNVENQNE
jgi:hypothetical protein